MADAHPGVLQIGRRVGGGGGSGGMKASAKRRAFREGECPVS